jgi:hypothetical protein
MYRSCRLHATPVTPLTSRRDKPSYSTAAHGTIEQCKSLLAHKLSRVVFTTSFFVEELQILVGTVRECCGACDLVGGVVVTVLQAVQSERNEQHTCRKKFMQWETFMSSQSIPFMR